MLLFTIGSMPIDFHPSSTKDSINVEQKVGAIPLVLKTL